MWLWLFLSFSMLVFILAVVSAIAASILTLLFYRNLDYFLPIFKAGFFPGSVGILLVLIIGHLFESEINQASNFGLLWLVPVVLTCIGLTLATIRIYRTNHQ